MTYQYIFIDKAFLLKNFTLLQKRMYVSYMFLIIIYIPYYLRLLNVGLVVVFISLYPEASESLHLEALIVYLI